MPRIPTSIRTSQPVGSTNPAVKTSRSVAPTSVQSLGPFQPKLQMRSFADNRAQSATNQAVGTIKAAYDADQNIIPRVAFTAETPIVVLHGLGRAFVGANVVNVRPANVGDVPYGMFFIVPNSDSRLDASQVTLQGATTCLGDVVVW